MTKYGVVALSEGLRVTLAPRGIGVEEPGIDAHVIHHFAKLAGSRYQDFLARASKRIAPPKL